MMYTTSAGRMSLAVFSSYVAGSEQGAPVAALTEEQVDKLREIMWAMNAVDYATHAETAVIKTTDKNGKATTTEITETVLVIRLTHKTPDEKAADYHFTTRQNNYLQLLQDPQHEELWAELLGGFAQGGGELMNPDSTRTPHRHPAMDAAGCGYDYLAVRSPCRPNHWRGQFPHWHRHCLCRGHTHPCRRRWHRHCCQQS